MEKKIIEIKNSSNEKLIGTVYKTPSSRSAAVIMTAGYTSKRENSTNKAISKILYDNGISSILVDLSGHGDSEGKIEDQTILKARNDVESIYQYVLNLDWVDSSNIAFLGSSFSANSIIIFAQGNEKIRALALKSPITDYYATRLHQMGQQKMDEWKRNGIIILDDGKNTKSKYQFCIDAMKINTYEAISNIKAPIYIVQGDMDEDIPQSHIKKLNDSLKAKDIIKIIKGANHGYKNLNHFEKMIKYLSVFLIKQLS